MNTHIDFASRIMGELVSLGVILGSFAAALPTIAVVLGIVWYAMMICDWIQKKRTARKQPIYVRDDC